ncbi:MAG: DNA polymerase III subunit gamma/tau [Bacteroidales bacterium]|jgi:DNA polymerase-3 subunit gamma/tau|nr:DNA polymerase III subunit gamma/tau [Bacteroidales bacterium]MCI2134137.1 DNA polymerase III subunit gamma/tau [Bacteroidales bacterium]
MSDYIVSARKYRPDSFETLIGQDNIVQTLKNSIKRGKLAHAYLFCGPRGVGKTTTARLFAKAINCANPTKDMDPCGECESCKSFEEGRSYCIHELDAASNNGVDDIKNLMDQVQIPPQVGKYSVYIIDEVHMLSTAAFNAFLKTLEEPPAHAIFILATTEKHKILPTILSRCQTYDFNRISVPDIVRNLRMIATKENVSIDDESLHVIAQKADGAMRDALTIFDQTIAFCGTDVKYSEVLKNLNVIDYEYSFSLVDAFLAGDYGTALEKFDEILSKGFNALHFVAALSSHLRDLMVAKNGGIDNLLELPDSLKTRYREQADRCPTAFLFDALTTTTQCEAGYKMAVNPRLHIEYSLMKLSFLMKAPSNASVAPKSTVPVKAPAAVSEVPAKAEPAAAVSEVPAKAVSEPESAAPAVSVSETPAPRPRKKVSKSGASLSLNSIQEESEKKVTSSAIREEDDMPDEDAVVEAWKEMPEYCAKQPRLSSTLQNAEYSVAEKDGCKVLTFNVDNVAQQTWIRERQLHALEGYLQKKLGSTKFRLDVDVKPTEQKEMAPYTDEEKAKALMKENGEVGNLIKDFGLETK